MYQLPGTRGAERVAVAKEFFARKLPYGFTEVEQKAIRPFFTNSDSPVFFLHSFPPNMGASLLARYSRLKNRRGARGVWVDEFLPYLLASRVKEVVEMSKDESVRDPEASFLKKYQIQTLDAFHSFSSETRHVYGEFLEKCAGDPEYLSVLVESKRTRRMLSLFMDAYGHNSIARMASVWLCCEGVSMLAAKSIEWTRPGTGYIELSGRFVDLGKAETYPIWNEHALDGIDPEPSRTFLKSLFQRYEDMYGEGSGALPTFFRETHRHRMEEMTEADFERGVQGECFDVLSNLLPASTLTSVAIAASGEALPTILKHLVLDATAENFALVELIVRESEKIGAHQFVRHWEPTDFERLGWERLSLCQFQGVEPPRVSIPKTACEDALMSKFHLKQRYIQCSNMHQVGNQLLTLGRGYHDKLPSEFEAVSATFKGRMTFRGWRDLQRMSLVAHNRTDLTPELGFYVYSKPAPENLIQLFRRVETESRSLYSGVRTCEKISAASLEYIIPLGFEIGYDFTANLREVEFCNWQRSKHDVNHEVRKLFMQHDELLEKNFSWWSLFSRCAQYEKGREYLFARSEGFEKKGVLLK